MKMTNWCVTILSTSVLLAFCGCACSLKCYNCATSSEVECDRNQTLKECANPQLHCATAKFSKVDSSQTYMKACLPLGYINNYCSIINGSLSGLIVNCSISHCSLDYCNGPPPTTARVTSDAVVSTSTLEATTKEPSTTVTKPETKSGSPSTNFVSNVLGLTMTVFTLGQIL